MRRKGTIALRRIDIDNWQSQVAREHRINSIPQLWLYDGTKLVTKDRNEVLALIR